MKTRYKRIIAVSLIAIMVSIVWTIIKTTRGKYDITADWMQL